MVSSRRIRRRVLSFALLIAALLLPSGAFGAELILKLRGEGRHAIDTCAEELSKRGRSFASASAARSDSLDRLTAKYGAHGTRAVFRRPDGRSLAAQRRVLERRIARAAGPRARKRAPASAGGDLADVYSVRLAGGVDARAAAADFAADPHVVWAQPDYDTQPDRLLDDPFLASSGSWGQDYPDQWGIHAIAAPEAWDVTLGEGVVVGVVDSGVDLAHPDLVGNLWVNPGEDLDGDGIAEPSDENGIDDDGNGFVDDLRGWDFQGAGVGEGRGGEGDADPTDESGHGTHVAGIVAARGDNGLALAGVAPRATVMPVRVFPPEGGAPASVVWAGVLYAAMNGAEVINASFSCGSVCRDNPIAADVLGIVSELGVVYVTSAGNAALDVQLKTPERLRESIVVGSLGPPVGATLSAFSSVGLLVDVAAPGTDVLSLAAAAAPDFFAAFRFVGDLAFRLNGTSMAAPHVSGVVALLLADDPGLDPEAVRAILRASADDLGVPGHDAVFGAGRLNAGAALRHGRPPDLRGRIDAPLPGDTLSQPASERIVSGSIAGGDVAHATLELGAGSVPEGWEPLLLRARPGDPGRAELARLPLLEDGAYVLRLTLESADGTIVREHTPFSVDRAVPVFVSAADREAGPPDVSGRRVVWPSTREGADGPVTDLHAGVFGRTGERVLVSQAGQPFDVSLSQRGVAWLEREDGVGRKLSACHWRGLRGHCDPYDVLAGAETAGRPQLAGRLLAFIDAAMSRTLRTCAIGQAGCRGGPVADAGEGVVSPVIDRARLVWSRTGPGEDLATCRVAADGSCAATGIGSNVASLQPVALSGNWLVATGLSQTSFPFRLALYACRLDEDFAFCDAREITTFAPGTSADLSGRRLVWHAEGTFGQADVFWCELADDATCTPRALTRDAARQRFPRIDGRRIVWLDDRDGVPRIVSFLLPRREPRGRSR